MAKEHNLFPQIPEQIGGIGELAYNLWWGWHPSARMLYKTLSRPEWKESVHNPVKLLRELPVEVFLAAANDPEYTSHYSAIMDRFRSDMEENGGWFSTQYTSSCCLPIAFFSAEYGLHRSLPFYAGGLGFLAGDYLKECSDLNIPLVGVGFMYPEGYILQRIREDGWQLNFDDILDRDSAPITRVLDKDGKQLIIEVPFIQPPIHVAVWKVMVGRIPLYLMDTDISENDPWNRSISSHLYSGDSEQRLRQEIVLGIGGTAMLNVLGIRYSIAHLNEGHPAFVLLERIREKVAENMSYSEASEYVRNTTIFTTHTPVPAGTDIFSYPLMEKYFNGYYSLLGLDRETFFKLGIHPEKPESGFNMTAFALRLSRYHNAVSKRHGEVSRHMWKSLWPDTPETEVPIRYITNGIHVPTWIEPKMEQLLDRYLGKDWKMHHDEPSRWDLIDTIPDEVLWQTHYWLKVKLLNRICENVRTEWANREISSSVVMAEGILLDPSYLTLGFSRRFASYKRADLIFTNLERLKDLINDRWKPIQIIFAGKAHPNDDQGKQILQRVFNYARNSDMGGRIAFVENYDEQLAQYLVHGVDVWLNNPLPPMEACGTSGMKASLNGVPHMSIPDGWWIEGYNGKNGWTFGKEVGENRDKADAEAMYDLLKNTIVPLYYEVDGQGIPHGWVHVMKEAMKSVGPVFSSRRMVKEYVQKFYLEALNHVH
ncbi:alpha-glucan phosphorylase [Methanospirillum lacunae]|uniref:glycogen phosphorylase n=2 Tax=Methanospirillum lacunae TaxID=668570 RepID=A0A2V2MNI7_9EURY|nr:alpha-glucan phosphorylase [Methanospirillum lacunae]